MLMDVRGRTVISGLVRTGFILSDGLVTFHCPDGLTREAIGRFFRHN